MIKLCTDLHVESPDTSQGVPAKLKCGICHRIFVWNEFEEAYICVEDGERDVNLNTLGHIYKEAKEVVTNVQKTV